MARKKEARLTKEQALEIVKCSEDPIYCIKNYMSIYSIEHGKTIPFNLFPYQEKFINLMHSERLVVTTQSRQLGKTEVACAFLLWEALFNKKQCILITSYDLASAVELIDRVKSLYDSMPEWLVPGIVINNRASFKLANKSKIAARACTKKSGRGLSITRVICDELAIVDKNKANEFWESIVPVISSGGKLCAMSTPKGDSGLFYELWRDAHILKKGEFKSLFVHWSEHPSRDAKWEKTMRAALGNEERWRQEMECDFLSGADVLIDLKLLDHLKTLVCPPLEFVPNALSNPNWEVFKPRIQDVEYFITVDSSEGGGNDNSVINVFDDKLEQVAQYVDNYTDEDALAELIYKASQYYNEAMIYVEAESTGKAVLSLLERTYDIGELLARTKPSAKPGFRMTQSRRNTGISAMRQNIKHGRIKLNSTKTLDEFRFFKRKPGSAKYEAEYGTHDDMIMSIVLLCSELDRLADGNDKIHETLYELNEGDEDYTNEEATDYEPVAPISSNNTNPLEQEFEWV